MDVCILTRNGENTRENIEKVKSYGTIKIIDEVFSKSMFDPRGGISCRDEFVRFATIRSSMVIIVLL